MIYDTFYELTTMASSTSTPPKSLSDQFLSTTLMEFVYGPFSPGLQDPESE